jgi:hypothetical protein
VIKQNFRTVLKELLKHQLSVTSYNSYNEPANQGKAWRKSYLLTNIFDMISCSTNMLFIRHYQDWFQNNNAYNFGRNCNINCSIGKQVVHTMSWQSSSSSSDNSLPLLLWLLRLIFEGRRDTLKFIWRHSFFKKFLRKTIQV